MTPSNANVALDVSPQKPKRTGARSVSHGVYTPVVHFEPGEHAILDRGLSVVVVKHQRDGFVLVYLERGSPAAQTKVHHTRLRKAS